MTRPAVVFAALAVLTLVALGGQTLLVARAGFLMGDFHAFYCAGRAAAERTDPYRTEPLRSCERAVGLRSFFARHPNGVVPAPLPGYALAPFVALAALPPVAAAALWLALSLAACAIAVAAVIRFTGVAWPVPLGAFVLSLGAASLPFGEIVPVAVGAICAAAYFAWRGRWRSAAIAAAIAMIEPHLGLPVCLALAVWAPRTRVTLAVCAAAAALLSLATIGPAANLEYFARVLPAHALAEVARDTQFSLTSVLASLGTNPDVAVRVGTLWYVAMLLLGTVVAGRLWKRTQHAAWLVCIPPAFAVFGGTFVHVTQIAVALPAAMLLLAGADAGARRSTIAVVAVMLLAVPWIMAWSPALGLAPAFPIAYLAWRYWGGTLTAILVAALAAALALIGFNQALLLGVGHVHAAVMPAIDPTLAEAAWAQFTSYSSNGSLGAWLVRVPTWAGLALVLGLASTAANLLTMKAAPRSVLS